MTECERYVPHDSTVVLAVYEAHHSGIDISKVHLGRAALDVAEHVSIEPTPDAYNIVPALPITPRQTRAVQLISQGILGDETAKILHVSWPTLKTDLAKARRQLHALGDGSFYLTRRAIEYNIVSPPPISNLPDLPPAVFIVMSLISRGWTEPTLMERFGCGRPTLKTQQQQGRDMWGEPGTSNKHSCISRGFAAGKLVADVKLFDRYIAR